jgi:predicted transcriptional regulator
MNFNVYLDDKLGEALKRLARRRKLPRNALIRQAVEDLMSRENDSASWSPRVLAWEGDPAFEPFEERRVELRPQAADPFA